MAQLPPWVSVSPADFTSAARAGLQAGLERTSIAQGAATAQASREQGAANLQAELAARAQQAHASLEAQQQQFALSTKMREEQMAQQHEIQQQRNRVEDAYRQNLIEMQKQRLAQTAQEQAARLELAKRQQDFRENPKTKTAHLGNELFQMDPETGEWKKVAQADKAAGGDTIVKDLATRKKLEDQVGQDSRWSVFGLRNPIVPGKEKEVENLKSEIEGLNQRIQGGGSTNKIGRFEVVPSE